MSSIGRPASESRISSAHGPVRPGDRLTAGVVTRNLDAIWGSCADHTELWALKRDVLAALSYEFEFPSGRRRVPATELMR